MRSDTNLHPWVPVDGVTLPLLPGMVGIDTRFMRLMFLLPTDIGLILDCIPCKWPAIPRWRSALSWASGRS